METTSTGPLAATAFAWQSAETKWIVTVCAKATFVFGASGELAHAEPQLPVGGEALREDGRPYAPSDRVPWKHLPEVFVVGARPGSSPLRLRVGELEKVLPAAPGAELALGPLPSGQRERSLPAEAIAWVQALERGAPAGPMPRSLDTSYFQAAPRDQQVGAIEPGLAIELENLSPLGPRITLRLPPFRPRAVGGAGATRDLPLRCDSLWVDAARGVLTLGYRAAIPVASAEEARAFRVAVSAAPAGKSAPLPSAPRPANAPRPVLPFGKPGLEAPLPAASGERPAWNESTRPVDRAKLAKLSGTATFPASDCQPGAALPFRGAPPAAEAARSREGERSSGSSALPFVPAPRAELPRPPPVAPPGVSFAAAQLSVSVPVPPFVAPSPAASPPAPVSPWAASGPAAAQPAPTLSAPHPAPLPTPAPPPSATAPPAPPPRLDSPGKLSLATSAEPAPSPGLPPPRLEAEPAPASAPGERLPLEVYAALSAGLAVRGASRSEVLAAHGVTEGALARAAAAWTPELAASKPLSDTFDATYVGAHPRLREVDVEGYARIVATIERGALTQVTRNLDVPLGDVLRLQRVWTKRITLDPKLGLELFDAIERARQAG